MQEKSVPFFTARCMSYCFYREIFICGDCAVATPFKMPSNTEILYMLACEGEEGGRIARMEETIARALSVNWTEFDIPGNYKW